MSIKNFQKMDVNILLSIVNMQLRDSYHSLDDLAKFYDIDLNKLSEKLSEGNFVYDKKTNQYKISNL